MICDNCGANIDKGEEYCPNCGMELLTPKIMKKKDSRNDNKPENQSFKPAKKKYENSRSFSRDNSQMVEKPIKQRYIDYSEPESPDYSHYHDENEYEEAESPQQEYYEEEYKEKSGTGMGSIILLLFIALALGFIVGLLMFGSQSIPQIPGFNG
jgi:hypothetical protein